MEGQPTNISPNMVEVPQETTSKKRKERKGRERISMLEMVIERAKGHKLHVQFKSKGQHVFAAATKMESTIGGLV